MGRQRRVLVIDDDPSLRELARALFEGLYDVRLLPDGEHAVETARAWKPDLIILDVTMPGPDGFAICEWLKADTATRAIPVVLLTAAGTLSYKLRGRVAGADAYLTKPFSPSALLVRMADLIRARERPEPPVSS